MKTYYSVDYAVLGMGQSVAWFDNKEDALEFSNAGDYRDKPVAHKASNQDTIDEYGLLVAQTAEWLRQRAEEGEFLVSNWGGAREGAGRPATGRKRKSFYITDEEAEILLKRLEELRK